MAFRSGIRYKMMRKMIVIQCPECKGYNSENAVFCSACATRLSDSDLATELTQTIQPSGNVLAPGTLFAKRFSVIEELGRGGMGRVYRVLDKKLEVEIALKLLRPEIVSDPQIVQRFKNELKLARMISHNNVCRMYDFSEDQGTYYITMEYVSGEDLKTTIKRVGALSPRTALSISRQICEGLEAAHRLDVIHRDLKPHNIMLDKSGIVRIMDFGISRSLKAQGVTATGMMVGTPEYISPEQAEGARVDKRSDIYSFGVILFEMLTGNVPFKADTTISLLLKHKMEPPPNPIKFNPQISKELSRIILKCLEKDKSRRYQDVGSLQSDLGKVEFSLGKAGAGKPAGEKAGRAPGKARLKPRTIGVIAAGILIMAAGIVGLRSLNTKREVPEKKAPAVTEPEKGEIAVSGTPEAATVFVNGLRRGESPLNIELEAGTYEVRVEKAPEYKPHAETIVIKNGLKFQKTYALIPIFLARITSEPTGADIFIDRAYYGKTPGDVEVSKNTCSLELRKGTEWISSSLLELKPGANWVHRNLTRIVVENKYSISLNANPSDARIAIGKGPAEQLPLVKMLPAGTYEIRVEREGYLSQSFILNVNSDITHIYRLEKAPPARVVFDGQPYANVLVNDRLVGEVPPSIPQELEAGKYIIKYVAQKLNLERTFEIEIKPGEKKKIFVNMITGDRKITDIENWP